MAQSVWGLQALIATECSPLDNGDFVKELAKAANGVVTGENLPQVATHVLLAAYRFANHLGIEADAELREHLRK